MTAPGAYRRKGARRALLATAGVGAVVVATTVAAPTETIAAFRDDVFAGAGFSAGAFGIQSSAVFDDSGFGDHVENPVAMVTTPVTLAPGGTSYAHVYLRTIPNSEFDATVSLAKPKNESAGGEALWDTHIMYRAIAVSADSSTTCNRDLLAGPGGTPIVNPASTLGGTPSGLPAFRLPALGGKTMACFEFTLDPSVVTEAPEANGRSVTPTWTFTAESQSDDSSH